MTQTILLPKPTPNKFPKLRWLLLGVTFCWLLCPGIYGIATIIDPFLSGNDATVERFLWASWRAIAFAILLFCVALIVIFFDESTSFGARKETTAIYWIASGFVIAAIFAPVTAGLAIKHTRLYRYTQILNISETSAAIDTYRLDNDGRPPDSLNQLVPDYIQSFNHTSIGQQINYAANDDVLTEFEDDDWVIYVCHSGFIDCNYYAYFPSTQRWDYYYSE